MDEFLFRFGGGPGGVEKILEGATFESEGGKAEDFGKALVVHGLHDHPDAACDAEFMGHNVGSAHGGVVTARSPDGIQIDDHGFVFPDEGEFVIKIVAGGDFATRAVDMEKDGGYRIVIGGLTDLEDEVVHHAGSDLSGDFLGDDSE